MNSFDLINTANTHILSNYENFFMTVNKDTNKYLFNSLDTKTNGVSNNSFIKIPVLIQFNEPDILYKIQFGKYLEAPTGEPITIGEYSIGANIIISYKKKGTYKIHTQTIEVINSQVNALNFDSSTAIIEVDNNSGIYHPGGTIGVNSGENSGSAEQNIQVCDYPTNMTYKLVVYPSNITCVTAGSTRKQSFVIFLQGNSKNTLVFQKDVTDSVEIYSIENGSTGEADTFTVDTNIDVKPTRGIITIHRNKVGVHNKIIKFKYNINGNELTTSLDIKVYFEDEINRLSAFIGAINEPKEKFNKSGDLPYMYVFNGNGQPLNIEHIVGKDANLEYPVVTTNGTYGNGARKISFNNTYPFDLAIYAIAFNANSNGFRCEDTQYFSIPGDKEKYTLEIDKTETIDVESDENISLTITSNTVWNINANVDWITFTKQASSGTETITCKTGSNGPDERIGIITVSSLVHSKTCTLTIKQKPGFVAAKGRKYLYINDNVSAYETYKDDTGETYRFARAPQANILLKTGETKTLRLYGNGIIGEWSLTVGGSCTWYNNNQGKYPNGMSVSIKGGKEGPSHVTCKVMVEKTGYVLRDVPFSITVDNNFVFAQKVSIVQDKLEMTLGETTTLQAMISPTNVTYAEVVWSVSNGNAVSVDINGNVKAINVGTSKIVATSADSNAKAWIQVTVKDV